MEVNATFSYINPVSYSPVSISVEVPRKCPHCSTGFSAPPEAGAAFWAKNGQKFAYAIYFCPYCETGFYCDYNVFEDDPGIFYGQITKTYPCPSNSSIFSDKILSLSPQFANVYQQSEQAENIGLEEICGIGYRKALEFLVKDYAISKFPDKRSDIESSLLGKCISTYIENPKIRALATASSWLGNDEAHFTRKHEEYSLKDLKRFIQTTVAYIEYEFNYEEAFAFLSPR